MSDTPRCVTHGIEGCICLCGEIRGPLDGHLATYYFACLRTSPAWETFKVDAVSLRRAIRMFYAGADFPHEYAVGRIATRKVPHSNGHSNMSERTLYEACAPDGYVPVWASIPGVRGWSEVARIPPEQAADSPQALLGVAPPEITSLVRGALGGSSAALTRAEREQRSLEIGQQFAALEQQRRELQLRAKELQAEVAQRLEEIWVTELYCGSKEQVHVIRDGDPAAEETPIAIRQAVLCMDEEIAVHDWLLNPARIGEFDYRHVADFDRWLAADPSALATICPWPKGVVGMRVRRVEKERPHLKDAGIAGAFQAMAEAEADTMTYLYIRNGQKLFRVDVDVKLWPRLFAADVDIEQATTEQRWESDQRAAKDRLKHQLAGLFAIQGILDRSELLHPLPRPRLSVLHSAHAEHFLRINDGESRRTLVDATDALAHVSWHSVRRDVKVPVDPAKPDGRTETQLQLVQQGYRDWLKAQLRPGCRVLYIGPRHWSSTDYWRSLEKRTGRKTVDYGPRYGEVYVLEASEDGSMPFSFKYHPGDAVRNPNARSYNVYVDEDPTRPRKNRVTFRCYEDEVMPLDALSPVVLEHLIRDRNQREQYGSFFRLAFDYFAVARQEQDREAPFCQLVLRQAGAEENDANLGCVRRLVRWWKLKVAENRSLSEDEAKALRMIVKAFNAGQDFDDDPEKKLLDSLSGAAREEK